VRCWDRKRRPEPDRGERSRRWSNGVHLTPAPLLIGEGFCRGSGVREDSLQTYPHPPNLPYSRSHPTPEGRPTGGMLIGGVGAAPAGEGCASLPGGFGNRPGGNTTSARGARYTAGRQTAPGRRTRLAPGELASAGSGDPRQRRNRKRGPGSSKSPPGGAPRGVRRVAQSFRAASWLDGCGFLHSRLAALRCPSSRTPAG
jgi:hypothetical protein